MAIIRNSLLAKVNPGLLGEEIAESTLSQLTTEEEAEIEVLEHNIQNLSTDVQALEDMEEVANHMEEQVVQNEVNLAAIQGEEVPAEGEDIAVTEQVEEVSEDGSVTTNDTVIAEGEAPAAELSQDSTPAEVMEATDEVRQGLESVSLLLSSTNAFARGGLMSLKSKSINKRRITAIGIESMVANPVEAYKQACLNYKVGLCSVKETIVNFFKDLLQKIKDFFKNFSLVEKFVTAKSEKIASKYNELDVAKSTITSDGNHGCLLFFKYGGFESLNNDLNKLKDALNKATSIKTLGSNIDAEQHKLNLVAKPIISGDSKGYMRSLYKELSSEGFIDNEDDDILEPLAIPTSVKTVCVIGRTKPDFNFVTKTVTLKTLEEKTFSPNETAEILKSIQDQTSTLGKTVKNTRNILNAMSKEIEGLGKIWENYADSIQVGEGDDSENERKKMDKRTAGYIANLCRFGTKASFAAGKTPIAFLRAANTVYGWVNNDDEEKKPAEEGQ